MSWQKDFQDQFGLDPQQVRALEQLLELLLSSEHNLTAISDPAEVVDIHFRDSLSLLSFAEIVAASSAVDIGSGAGFPGLPLAIALPHLQVTLLESNQKKSDFLRQAATSLGLANISVWPLRAEAAGQSDRRESFDLALARAVGSLPLLLEYALPLLKPGGHALLQRGGRDAGDEALAAAVAVQLGGHLSGVTPVSPYPKAKQLHIWSFGKSSATPAKFPRRIGIPKKRPLGL